jgi:cobalt/nickel transport system permease protein
MLCRGFTGRFPTRESFRSTPLDWALGACWILGGVAVLLLDRYETLPFSGVFR